MFIKPLPTTAVKLCEDQQGDYVCWYLDFITQDIDSLHLMAEPLLSGTAIFSYTATI